MSRLIEADAVYKILESCEIKKDTYGSLLNDWDHGYNCGIERAESEIECAPTVDAVPVRHGKWKQWDDYGFEETYECTACGESFVLIEGTPITNGYKYCPSCGAKMDAEEKEE